MDRHPRPSVRTCLLVTICVVLASQRGSAMAPPIIMVHGGTLERPVFLTDWWENLDLVAELPVSTDFRPADEVLEGRPFIALSLFWGAWWADYVKSGGSLAKLEPAQAGQHARFYPRVGDSPAMIIQTSPILGAQPLPKHLRSYVIGGRVSPVALAILERHKLPIQVQR